MIAPRLEIDLEKISHNARTLVVRLAERGISVTGVTKATLGSSEIADAWLGAGVKGIGDSRLQNIEAMRRAHVHAPMTLIRSPMLSQAGQVVAQADLSFNTELDVISKLSSAAKESGRIHGVVLMVELGDLREGIMPSELEGTVRETLRFPNIRLEGIGTNLACCNGVSPDAGNMGELSDLADAIDRSFGIVLGIVSGGNSGNLQWAFSGADVGRINDLRLGESLLLGRESLYRQPIEGLHTDAITLIAEVIEVKKKTAQPGGVVAQTAFGTKAARPQRGSVSQAILALGHQDVDPGGLEPPAGYEITGASSDHLLLGVGEAMPAVGAEMRFQLNYSALLRAMTSPFVHRRMSDDCEPSDHSTRPWNGTHSGDVASPNGPTNQAGRTPAPNERAP